jgi:hypothetical protein
MRVCKQEGDHMLARKPRNLDDGARCAVRPTLSHIVPPTSRTWTLAVHEAGHCVMAYLLDLGISRAVIRPANSSGNVWWRHAGRRYERFRDEPYSRAVIEADALVALAGAAAQWLYRDGSVRAVDLGHDDRVAASILRQLEQADVVILNWREYLRQRALRMLSEQRHQALTARLAGLFVERERLRGEDIYAFLEHEEARVADYLLDGTATIEDYVGLIGTDEFARPVESLGLSSRATTCLHGARITTIGQLLQHSSYDLAPIKGLGKYTLQKIEEAVTAAGLELATYPRSNCREVYFSAASIYARDAEFAQRKQRNAASAQQELG